MWRLLQLVWRGVSWPEKTGDKGEVVRDSCYSSFIAQAGSKIRAEMTESNKHRLRKVESIDTGWECHRSTLHSLRNLIRMPWWMKNVPIGTYMTGIAKTPKQDPMGRHHLLQKSVWLYKCVLLVWLPFLAGNTSRLNPKAPYPGWKI